MAWKDFLHYWPIMRESMGHLYIHFIKGMWCRVTVNSLRLRQNGRHFPDNIFKCIFLNENVCISLKISLKFVPEVRISNIPALVQIMAWGRPATSHYLNQWWLIYWCIYASLGLNELIFHHRVFNLPHNNGLIASIRVQLTSTVKYECAQILTTSLLPWGKLPWILQWCRDRTTALLGFSYHSQTSKY